MNYGFLLLGTQTSNSYFVCNDPPTIERIFTRLRNYDGKVCIFCRRKLDVMEYLMFFQASQAQPTYPSNIAGLKVTAIRDLTVGYDSTNPPSYKPTLPLSSGHMVQFRAENSAEGTKISLTIRTSGTEPKVSTPWLIL